MEHRLRNAHESEIKFGPVGKCIYCGDDKSPLSDEHIIPDGLGGNLILVKASCFSCAKITGNVEQQVLQRTFGAVRAELGIRSPKSIKAKRAAVDKVLIRFGPIE